MLREHLDQRVLRQLLNRAPPLQLGRRLFSLPHATRPTQNSEPPTPNSVHPLPPESLRSAAYLPPIAPATHLGTLSQLSQAQRILRPLANSPAHAQVSLPAHNSDSTSESPPRTSP